MIRNVEKACPQENHMETLFLKSVESYSFKITLVYVKFTKLNQDTLQPGVTLWAYYVCLLRNHQFLCKRIAEINK